MALAKTPIAKQHRHIDITAQGRVVALAGDQAHIHLWVGFVKAMQTWHQPIGSEGEVSRHLQHFVLVLLCDRAQARINALQPGLNMFEQQHARVRQFDATVDAIKQAHRQLFFQALDLLTDSRLGGAQLHGRCGEAAMTGGRFKGPQ